MCACHLTRSHIRSHTRLLIHSDTPSHSHLNTRIQTRIHIPTYAHVHTHVLKRSPMRSHTRSCMRSRTPSHINTFAHAFTQSVKLRLKLEPLCVCKWETWTPPSRTSTRPWTWAGQPTCSPTAESSTRYLDLGVSNDLGAYMWFYIRICMGLCSAC